MAAYTVDTGQLRLLAEQIDKLQQQMDSVALRLTAFQMGTTMQMRGSAVLMARIGDYKWAVINQSDNLGRMSRGLAEAAGIYERTEAGLKEPRTEAQARQQAEAARENGHFWDPFLDNPPILEMIGFAVEATGRNVWNLGDVFANGVAWVMGGVESLFDNVEEFSDNLLSNQFLFELVGEASVDVGLGAGVSAAIVAVVGAPVSVPAVLGLAAASAVICWVGDCLCEWATGDDISELIVDSSWNALRWLGNTAEDLGESVSTFVSDTVDFVQEGAEAMWNRAGEFVDTLLPW